jgi:hypothetical protein
MDLCVAAASIPVKFRHDLKARQNHGAAKSWGGKIMGRQNRGAAKSWGGKIMGDGELR